MHQKRRKGRKVVGSGFKTLKAKKTIKLALTQETTSERSPHFSPLRFVTDYDFQTLLLTIQHIQRYKLQNIFAQPPH